MDGNSINWISKSMCVESVDWIRILLSTKIFISLFYVVFGLKRKMCTIWFYPEKWHSSMKSSILSARLWFRATTKRVESNLIVKWPNSLCVAPLIIIHFFFLVIKINEMWEKRNLSCIRRTVFLHIIEKCCKRKGVTNFAYGMHTFLIVSTVSWHRLVSIFCSVNIRMLNNNNLNAPVLRLSHQSMNKLLLLVNSESSVF